MLRVVFCALLLCLTTADLDYREQLWVRNLEHTTYDYYLKNYQRLRQQYALKLFARGRTTFVKAPKTSKLSHMKIWAGDAFNCGVNHWFSTYTKAPTPLLSIPFIENATKHDDNSSYVGLNQVFSPPRTIDDEIGLPLNQPLGGQKVSLNRYLDPYLYYRNNPYGRK